MDRRVLIGTVALAGLVVSCEAPPGAPRETGASSSAQAASATPAAPSSAAPSSAAVATPSAAPRCAAPSLDAAGPLDGRSASDLARCVDPRSPERKGANRCADPKRALDAEHLLASVPPLDAATRARIAVTARRGRGLGRNPRAFGLLGDSMTASSDFLEDFGVRRRRSIEIAPELAPHLTLPSGRSVVDFFRGQAVERLPDGIADAFTARRAARVGARAPWVLEYDDVDASPLGRMVQAVDPAYAVVLFGGNDAAYRVAPPEDLASELEQNLLGIVQALERRGVVPILTTPARHLDQPGVPNCAEGELPSDHRVAVATTAISDRVAQVACREHLPLVDLRHALDRLVHRGLGADGVHPNVHPRGGAILTGEGLACGYNVRNAVTLLGLTRVVGALVEDGAIDPG